jgi:hypothetical protein
MKNRESGMNAHTERHIKIDTGLAACYCLSSTVRDAR